MDTPAMDTPAMIAHLDAEIARLAEVVATTDPSADVPTCPGWTVSKLASHVGTIHRWATAIVETGEQVDARSLIGDRPGREATASEWAAWLTAGGASLVNTLGAADPTTPAWSWAHGDEGGTAQWWIRRQLHETAVHRIDAELAAGNGDWTIDPAVAVDGVDEHLANIVASGSFSPKVADLNGDGSLHFHATDLDGEWMIVLSDDGFKVTHEHGKGTVAARGPARDLLAAVTNRSTGHTGLEVFGDESLLAWWFEHSALA